MACGILIPWPETKPRSPAVETWSPNHRAARESPRSHFWTKPFCDLSLATKLALEQVSVISDLKGSEGIQEQKKKSVNNSYQWQNSPSSFSRDRHNNLIMSLSSAGTKAPTLVGNGMIMLTNMALIKQSLAVVVCAQLCLTLCDPMDCCPPGSSPWDFPGKNTGVGCHFLLGLCPIWPQFCDESSSPRTPLWICIALSLKLPQVCCSGRHYLRKDPW